jgi:hypothetical protein
MPRTDPSVARSPGLKASILLLAELAEINGGLSAVGIFQSMTPTGWVYMEGYGSAQIN